MVRMDRRMKLHRYTIHALAALVLSAAQLAYADDSAIVPAPLMKAAAAYKDKGAAQFLPTLVKGSRLQYTDSSSLAKAGEMLKAIETIYGEYIGIEMVDSVPISSSTRIVYFVLNYERGPLYGVADLYRTKYGEIVTNSNVNTELSTIIPPQVIVKMLQ